MNESEIIKRNEAIALFMGNNGSLYCDHCRKPYPETFPNGRLTKCCSTYDKGHKNAFYSTMDESGSVVYSIGKRTSRDLKYHSSWDWLIPVVEKLEGFEGINIRIQKDRCVIFDSGFTDEHVIFKSINQPTKIQAVFLAVSDYCLNHK
jgi:hypothetical protein